MGTFAGLRLCDLDALVPVLAEQSIPEGLRTIGVGSLTNRQVGHGLIERLVLIKAGEPRLIYPGWALWCLTLDRGCKGADVRGGCSTASANQPCAIFLDELLLSSGQLDVGEWIVRAVGGKNRKSGIRHDHEWQCRELG